MAGVDDLEVLLVLPERIERPVELDAGEGEDGLDALDLERVYERLPAGHVHCELPLLERRALRPDVVTRIASVVGISGNPHPRPPRILRVSKGPEAGERGDPGTCFDRLSTSGNSAVPVSEERANYPICEAAPILATLALLAADRAAAGGLPPPEA